MFRLGGTPHVIICVTTTDQRPLCEAALPSKKERER